jgi:hypothetical protein
MDFNLTTHSGGETQVAFQRAVSIMVLCVRVVKNQGLVIVGLTNAQFLDNMVTALRCRLISVLTLLGKWIGP